MIPTVQPSRDAWPTIWSSVAWIDCGRRIRSIASISSQRSNNFITCPEQARGCGVSGGR